VAGGPAIVLFTTVQFLVVLAVAPRYGLIAGWLRRRRMVPQTLVEDILRIVQKTESGAVKEAALAARIEKNKHFVRRALDRMLDDDLVVREGELLKLTPHGQIEATRVQRAHRLWETYLDRLGTPQAELHERAHELEHIHDEDTVDYLGAKLGHPLTDPHGSEIPQDFEHVAPGNIVELSLLRQGNRGTIDTVGELAAAFDLAPGMAIRLGQRSDDGESWTVILPNNREIELPHAAADNVLVRVESVE
jgi:manganese/iron transport system permease protein/iron/zinc/copper transport system permease protein